MTHIYGHRWTSSYGESAVDDSGNLTDVAKTWATALTNITGEQLAKGLRACCDDNTGEWPTIPMFKAKCIGVHKNDFGLNYKPQYCRTLEKSKLLAKETWEETKARVEPRLGELRKYCK